MHRFAECLAKKMKAVGIKGGKGDADALYIEDVPDPVLEKNNVLVRIKAFGLNRMDINQREGRYPYAIPPHWGNVMGVEFSGVVDELGPECGNGFKVGDKVFSLVYGGAYAENICVSENMLMHMPDGTGVDLIVDVVGRDYWNRNIQVAATDSRIVIVAVMSGGQIDEFNLRQLMNKRICLMTTTLRTRDSDYQVRLRNIFVEKILPHLADRRATTVVDKVFDWSNISEAHKRMESNSNAGKIICTIPS